MTLVIFRCLISSFSAPISGPSPTIKTVPLMSLAARSKYETPLCFVNRPVNKITFLPSKLYILLIFSICSGSFLYCVRLTPPTITDVFRFNESPNIFRYHFLVKSLQAVINRASRLASFIRPVNRLSVSK